MQQKKPITYSLTAHQTSSKKFYKLLSDLTDTIIDTLYFDVKYTVFELMQFVGEKKLEKIRSKNEYFIETLILGVLWNQYIARAVTVYPFVFSLLQFLNFLRKKFKQIKPQIDFFRGYLISKKLYFTKRTFTPKVNLKNFKKLIKYLRASGDFREESERLRNWYHYFKANKNQLEGGLNKFLSQAFLFEKMCSDSLGEYTSNVQSFIKKNTDRYYNKENIIFCTRKEVEYHLNMVCAEILNRELKPVFQATSKKIVLLPTCMRNITQDCKFQKNGLDRICKMCQPDCNIYQITRLLKNHQIETRLIPHSSEFSKNLQFWENQVDTGLVGIACVLNLLKGGYEMKKLNIPSQCVFLDFCGCKNHWDETGIPTNINRDQLLKILLNQSNDRVNK